MHTSWPGCTTSLANTLDSGTSRSLVKLQYNRYPPGSAAQREEGTYTGNDAVITCLIDDKQCDKTIEQT